MRKGKAVEVGESMVETPWLTTAEAAAYCGLSEAAFVKKARGGLPYAGSERSRRYLPQVLDVWIVRGFRAAGVDVVYEELVKR